MEDNNSVIELNDITKTFKSGFFKKNTIIKNLSLKVNKGDIYGFVGLNGAGKTTAIKIILGLMQPDSGNIKIFNDSIYRLNRQKIGFASEIATLPEHLTAMEFLTYLCNLSNYKISKNKILDKLAFVGLSDISNKLITNYSKGMKQRLSLAGAIIHNPELVILDEPSSGLDPLGRNMLKNVIKYLEEQKTTVFFSTHILTDIQNLCNKVGLIHNKTLLFEGTTKDFCPPDKTIEEAFELRINPRN